MRYTHEQSQQTRSRIIAAAARHFRTHGYGGIGIDGLVKAAGVTSGAFYNHFRSKADAFLAVAIDGLRRLAEGVAGLRESKGPEWLVAFAGYYLGDDHRRDIAGGCVLPSLTADIVHADPATREAYGAELVRIADLVAAGVPDGVGRQHAWPLLAQLAGGVMLSRAVADEALASEIAAAVRAAVISGSGAALPQNGAAE